MRRATDRLIWVAVIAAVTGVFYVMSGSGEEPRDDVTIPPRWASAAPSDQPRRWSHEPVMSRVMDDHGVRYARP